MASLPFNFCWHKHIFLMIIQIFIPLIFELLIPWTWLTPCFLPFWKTYIMITYWWLINILKTSNGVEWGWMMPHDVFFWNQWKTVDICKNITWKVVKSIISENNNIVSFQWRVIHPNRTSCSEISKIQIGRWQSRHQ